MTVGELKLALSSISHDLEIVIRAIDLEGDSICASISSIGIETAHDEYDTPFFAYRC